MRAEGPRGVDLDGPTRATPPRAAVAGGLPGRSPVLGLAAPHGVPDPPRARNRVWQTDFSEFETTAGGIWRICALIDYATNYCLAATVAPARGLDALGCLRRGVAEAERPTQLDDLHADRGPMDLIPADGTVIGTAPAPIAVVSDNGPCCRGATFAEVFADDDPLLRHVRTRARSLQTNGVGREVLRHPEVRAPLPSDHRRRRRTGRRGRPVRQTYNTLRPHQALADRTPRDAYLAHPTGNQ